MNRFLLVLIACGFAARAFAEEDLIDLTFPKADVRDILSYYRLLMDKPVFLKPELAGIVAIDKRSVPRKDAPAVIRKTLVENYGIAMRETKEGEWLVERSQDPKIPRRSEQPRTEEEGRGDLQFPKTDLRDVLAFYGNRVKKPVFVSYEVSATITIVEANVAMKDVPELIRKTLLQKYGIAMRETKDGEVLVEWSTDPKYPRRSDPPGAEAERKTAPRVRPIGPKGIPIPR